MSVPSISESSPEKDFRQMTESACAATRYLKAISHQGRLMILCHLAEGEKSVTELEQFLAMRQAAVSQQLSRLRKEGLVRPRRDGKAIFYSIADHRARQILDLVYELFCMPDNPSQPILARGIS